MHASQLIAGRFDKLRTGTPRSYSCLDKSFSDGYPATGCYSHSIVAGGLPEMS
jgi:hypothetical protein